MARRDRGNRPLGRTTVLLAGTRIERLEDSCNSPSVRIIEHDVILPLDCVGEYTVLLAGEEWYVSSEAIGWAESDY